MKKSMVKIWFGALLMATVVGCSSAQESGEAADTTAAGGDIAAEGNSSEAAAEPSSEEDVGTVEQGARAACNYTAMRRCVTGGGGRACVSRHCAGCDTGIMWCTRGATACRNEYC